MTSFMDVYDVLEENKKKLEKHFEWNKEVITNKKTKSELRFSTSNAKTKDGEKQGEVDFDEYHQYEEYKTINVFKTGLCKKKNPRTTITTTNGYVRDGPLDKLIARAVFNYIVSMPNDWSHTNTHEQKNIGISIIGGNKIDIEIGKKLTQYASTSKVRIEPGIEPNAIWRATIPSGQKVTIEHNLGHIPIVNFSGRLSNLEITMNNVSKNVLEIFNYSSGGNDWGGDIIL